MFFLGSPFKYFCSHCNAFPSFQKSSSQVYCLFNCNSTQTGTVVTDDHITFCLVFAKSCIAIPTHKSTGDSEMCSTIVTASFLKQVHCQWRIQNAELCASFKSDKILNRHLKPSFVIKVFSCSSDTGLAFKSFTHF